ncbi:hypothetical protein [Ereboglobus luteus]|uniref:Uncharacterized protein n=1 Tax=Ereboglobus luteus TaxID=1796921 RepID=A0A2U8E399_9BACT|nr:hypothetical protein [Ereboglobus luteus]AWI09246.1 hypothetical protein CKA38_08335 [Ereboglobus luteus]
MNKTLLLIICDFLLLNLLALTRWDAPIAASSIQQDPSLSTERDSPPAATKDQDLVDVMKLSLEDERARRDELARQLRDTELNLQTREQNLAQLEAEKNKLAENLDATQRNAGQLAQQIDTARQSAVLLAQEVDAAKRDAGMSKERIAALQRDLDHREAELAREKASIAKLEQAQTEARQKIEDLNVAVKVAEHEKTVLRETAETYKTQVEAERQERLRVQETTVQLAQGVGTLAVKSDDLQKEIRDNRPINANTLFSEYLANNVRTRVETTRPGLFGPAARVADLRTILVSDGRDTYAIFHASDTPFALTYPGADISRIAITFTNGDYSTTAGELHYLSIDPRILVVPLTPAQAAGLGVKVYMTSLEPFKFSDAILISTNSEPTKTKYEETPFKLDATQPGYVQMRVSFFASKRGDLVISKSGELLGIMVNKDYCALVNNFLPTRTITTGEDTGRQGIGALINHLNTRVQGMPLKLQ